MTTYKESGVDIEKADGFVKEVKNVMKKTDTGRCLNMLGDFASFYEMPSGYKNPVLVSSTDGVGTKLKLAGNNPDYLFWLGIDLGAMVINDIACTGAKCLYFLDYYATSNLQSEAGLFLMNGIAHACFACETALVGGETAEMPGIYKPGDFDIAGFATGIVEKDEIIDGSKVKHNNALIGLASSGPHSNGFSLINKILENVEVDPEILHDLMLPTTLYYPLVRNLIESGAKINGIAHITGGGIPGNLRRVIPNNLEYAISNPAEIPWIFKWIRNKANASLEEMYNTFNMGVGMILIVDPYDLDDIMEKIKEFEIDSFHMGYVRERNTKVDSEYV